MYNDVIKLISITSNVDESGDTVSIENQREVFAEMKSISQSEFYKAQAIGLKPEIKFVLSDYYDYENENFIEYEDKRYRVLRTYQADNTLEIVCVGDIHGST
jgi:phage head-tail adaptor, putative, SPP1 family